MSWCAKTGYAFGKNNPQTGTLFKGPSCPRSEAPLPIELREFLSALSKTADHKDLFISSK